MAIRKSVLNTSGRYVQGGITTQHPNRMGWWERTVTPQNDNDVFMEIPSIANKRPDILAFNYFGKANMAWLILQYNNIVDINVEFVTGKKIRLPSNSQALLSMNNKIGGVKP